MKSSYHHHVMFEALVFIGLEISCNVIMVSYGHILSGNMNCVPQTSNCYLLLLLYFREHTTFRFIILLKQMVTKGGKGLGLRAQIFIHLHFLYSIDLILVVHFKHFDQGV